MGRIDEVLDGVRAELMTTTTWRTSDRPSTRWSDAVPPGDLSIGLTGSAGRPPARWRGAGGPPAGRPWGRSSPSPIRTGVRYPTCGSSATGSPVPGLLRLVRRSRRRKSTTPHWPPGSNRIRSERLEAIAAGDPRCAVLAYVEDAPGAPDVRDAPPCPWCRPPADRRHAASLENVPLVDHRRRGAWTDRGWLTRCPATSRRRGRP